MTGILIVIVALIISMAGGIVLNHNQVKMKLADSKQQAAEYLANAKSKIKKDEEAVMRQHRLDADDYQKTTNEELDTQVLEHRTRTERLDQRNEYLNQFAERIRMDEQRVNELEETVKANRLELGQKHNQCYEYVQQRHEILLNSSNLDDDTVQRIVLDETRDELKWEREVELKYQDGVDQLNASRDAMNVIINGLQRGPDDVPRLHIERNITVPDFELRNWINGHDENHLRLIETLSGTDLIFDQNNPLLLHIVTHDPIRREVVRRALNNLIVSRQLTSENIEEQIQNAQIEVNRELYETGEWVVKLLHLKPMDPDLMRIIGKLKFRTSYGQNVLYHSIEVAQLTGAMAAELDIDSQLARRAGMLHDIGKAIDHEVEGTHVELGVKLTKAFKEDPIVINAIAAHHGDVEKESLIAVLVAASDGLSGARPGARSESVEEYVNRLKSLEKIANEQPGVKESYAIQAGREIRIIVNPKAVDDEQINKLATKVRNEIEDQLSYPGKIKVTLIRKLSAIQYVGYNPHHKKRLRAG